MVLWDPPDRVRAHRRGDFSGRFSTHQASFRKLNPEGECRLGVISVG
jgi:hypothetical protein